MNKKKKVAKTKLEKDIDISKSISAIREAILASEKDLEVEEKNNDYEKKYSSSIPLDQKEGVLLLSDIVSKGNLKPLYREEIADTNKLKIKNRNKHIKTKIIKKQTLKNEDRGLETALEREIKPIIKKWINKNLRGFVYSIVKEEIGLLSKMASLPKKR